MAVSINFLNKIVSSLLYGHTFSFVVEIAPEPCNWFSLWVAVYMEMIDVVK